MQQYVEQIKEILQPSAIIGRKVLLKFKSNGEYLGLCPFHLEKTPSFTVSDRKKFFHCFGCGESGDIFTFLIKLESVSYKEALRRLADEAGITLPNADEFKVSQEEKDKLSTFFNIHATLAEFYHNYLFSSYGQEAREYIKNRGITLELAKKAMLGFAPQDSKSVVNFLGKSFNHEAIVGSKILIYKNNSFYNHLSGRIIFPIHDSKNRVIAFGGRIINHGNPKYINSSDSPIFKKSDNLYGLNFINKIHAKSKKIVLVEGYLDVLAVLPYANAVAPLGTSLSISQIKKLWHISENPIICFDRDDAGKNASYRVAKEILSCITPTCSLSFATLSKGKDPDESIKKHGPQFFLNDLEKAIPLADFLFLQERDKSNIATPEGRVDFKQKLDRLVSQIENFEVQKSYKYYFLEKYKRQFSTFNKKQVSKELDVQNLKNIIGRLSDNKIEQHLLLLFHLLFKYTEYLKDPEVYDELIRIEISSIMLDRARHYLLNGKRCDDDLEATELSSILAELSSIEQPGLSKITDDQAGVLIKQCLLAYRLHVLEIQIQQAQLHLSETALQSDFERLSALKQHQGALKQLFLSF